jgi:hypothetical protein
VTCRPQQRCFRRVLVSYESEETEQEIQEEIEFAPENEILTAPILIELKDL